MGKKITWDEIFKKQQWGRYPNEMVVREVMAARGRFTAKQPTAADLGCGAGAHTTLLAENGFWVNAVDSSPEALHQARKTCAWRRVPSAQVNFFCRDYVKTPTTGRYDLVLDWLSLAHAPLGTIKRAAVQALGLLPRETPGTYILGLFGNNTSREIFKDRPKCTLIDSREIIPLINSIRIKWVSAYNSLTSPGLRQSSHAERMLYTCNGSQVELFCLVFSKD